MEIMNKCAYRYYNKHEGPLLCLGKLSYSEAIKIRHKFIKTELEQKNYLELRSTIEQIIYKSFMAKGGKPKNKYAYYFSIDLKLIIRDYFTDPEYLYMPLSSFDKEVISFTYGDSFLAYSRKDNHPTRRKVYTVDEIGKIADQFGTDFDENNYMAFIEMQLWDEEPLRKYCEENGLPPYAKR